MKVALAQVASPDDEPIEERRGRVEAWLRDEQLADAELIVLPELWGVGYLNFDAYASAAEPFDGPTVAMGRRVAAHRGGNVHVGSFVERTPEGTLRNTSAVVAPSGEVVHRYSKVHLFGYESAESRLLAPGDSLPVTSTPLGMLAGTTCYDLRFPGLWMEMSRRGAETVIVPAAWPAPRREHWRVLTTARALESQLILLACNAVGSQAGVEMGGCSRIIGPFGEVIAEASADSEELVIAEVDLARVADVRAQYPFLADRLADYATLAQTAGGNDE